MLPLQPRKVLLLSPEQDQEPLLVTRKPLQRSDQHANSVALGLLTALSAFRGSSGGMCCQAGKGDVRVMAPDTC